MVKSISMHIEYVDESTRYKEVWETTHSDIKVCKEMARKLGTIGSVLENLVRVTDASMFGSFNEEYEKIKKGLFAFNRFSNALGTGVLSSTTHQQTTTEVLMAAYVLSMNTNPYDFKGEARQLLINLGFILKVKFSSYSSPTVISLICNENLNATEAEIKEEQKKKKSTYYRCNYNNKS